MNTINELNALLLQPNLNEEDEIKVKILKEEIDKFHMDTAKGAFIRSRQWLEKGEQNSSYFFALEKRNQKRNNITSLKSGDGVLSYSKELVKYVENLYSNIYRSTTQPDVSDAFIDSIKSHIPSISNQFQSQCEQPITQTEKKKNRNKMF